MKTLFPTNRRTSSAVIAAILLAAISSTSIARGQITYLKSFGGLSSGTAAGQFFWPGGVAVSASGQVYVADTQNDRIEVINSSGQYVTYFGSSGTAAGQFNHPTGVAVSPTGEIYVADTYNNRIEKFFALSEWVSGSPHFDLAAVGYGQFLGTSLTMSGNQGLQVDGTLTIYPGGSLTTLGGNVTAGALTNSGTYSVNGGTVTVTGIAGEPLTNMATMTLNGGVVAGSLTNYPGGNMTAAGTVQGNLVNQGTFTQSGPLSVGGFFTNLGTATIGAGSQLLSGGNVVNLATLNLNGGAIVNQGAFTNSSTVNLNGGTIVSVGNYTNSGLVALNGGSITGGGNFGNGASGTIRGDGTIFMTLTNSGGLIYATGGNGLTVFSFSANQSGGELRVADGDSLTVWAAANGTFTNYSRITLQGPNAALNGDTTSNLGTISGQGRITNTITNAGTISAVGGQLVLAGPSIANNSPSGVPGTIESATGTGIVVSQGLPSNGGLIALSGGSFDNNGYAMSNNGSILGNGTFSTGGLANYDTVTLSDGNSNIFGAVTNSSGGTITTNGSSATTISFYGAVSNSSSSSSPLGGIVPAGYINEIGGTVRFLGGVTNHGILNTDPCNTYFSGLANEPSGVLQGSAGDSFFVTGAFTNAGQVILGGNSSMVIENAGALTQASGVLHLGTSATLTAGAVEINGGTLLADGPAATITASLDYASSSASTYQGVWPALAIRSTWTIRPRCWSSAGRATASRAARLSRPEPWKLPARAPCLTDRAWPSGRAPSRLSAVP